MSSILKSLEALRPTSNMRSKCQLSQNPKTREELKWVWFFGHFLIIVGQEILLYVFGFNWIFCSWLNCSFLGCCNFYGFLCTFECTSKIVGFFVWLLQFLSLTKSPQINRWYTKNVVFCKRIIILVVVQMLARARKWLGVDKKMEGEILTIPKVPNRKLFENAQITSIKGHVTSSWKFHPRICFKFFCSIIACRTQQNKNDNF